MTRTPWLQTMISLSVFAAAALRADEPPRAAELIEKALAAEGGPDAGLRDRLASAAREALRLAEGNRIVADVLREGLDRAEGQKEAAAVATLRGALREAKEVLTFKPTLEAETPKGFPDTTPVGEVRLRKYPSYRMARVNMKGTNSAFWQLFNHIKKNDIAMTAPVEMTYREGKGGEGARSSMAFLYGSRELGKLGADGPVEVVDVPASLAVSIGLRGDVGEKEVEQARRWLEDWLKDHEEYEASGPVRVMGYNSPFIRPSRRFSEVQIPVRKVK